MRMRFAVRKGDKLKWLIEGKWLVIDTHTDQVVRTYAARSKARERVDVLNLQEWRNKI